MKKILTQRFHFLTTLVAVSFAVTVFAIGVQGLNVVRAQTVSSPLTGWAWSDNIGWISLNCTDGGTNLSNICSQSQYNVSTTTPNASGNSYLTGDAWSDNIGWIKFGGLTSWPSGSGTTGDNAYIDSGGTLHGWARACAGTADGQCLGMNSRTDGWDGWISLDGTQYKVNLNTDGSGYTSAGSSWAWGSDVVGWITFNPSSGTGPHPCNPTLETCPCTGSDCGGGSQIPSVNLSINSGSSAITTVGGSQANLTWNSTYSTTCTASSSGSFGIDSNWNGVVATSSSGSGSATNINLAAGGTETYDLVCKGNSQTGGQLTNVAEVTFTVNSAQSGMCNPIPSSGWTLCSSSSSTPPTTTNSTLDSGSCGNIPYCEYYCPGTVSGTNCSVPSGGTGGGTLREQ